VVNAGPSNVKTPILGLILRELLCRKGPHGSVELLTAEIPRDEEHRGTTLNTTATSENFSGAQHVFYKSIVLSNMEETASSAYKYLFWLLLPASAGCDHNVWL
jgi:hypothetical protein